MNEAYYIKLPRLYVDAELKITGSASLDDKAAHYLGHVLRLKPGAQLRLFDGRNGEWLGEIEDIAKKSAAIKFMKQLRPQPAPGRQIHLLFAPIKKDRLDFLIEKSVELGATDLHPVLTRRTEIRKINEERLRAQIIEAAEQCERFDLPALHKLTELQDKLAHWNPQIPLLTCIERSGAVGIGSAIEGYANCNMAFLIGPEGGFDEREKEGLQKYEFAHNVSLGENILRAETAALKCLSMIN